MWLRSDCRVRNKEPWREPTYQAIFEHGFVSYIGSRLHATLKRLGPLLGLMNSLRINSSSDLYPLSRKAEIAVKIIIPAKKKKKKGSSRRLISTQPFHLTAVCADDVAGEKCAPSSVIPDGAKDLLRSLRRADSPVFLQISRLHGPSSYSKKKKKTTNGQFRYKPPMPFVFPSLTRWNHRM